jgi:hypothetical protein
MILNTGKGKSYTSSPEMTNEVKLEKYIQDWNLTEAEKRHLTGHFLRNWTQTELEDKLVFDQTSGVVKVSLWKVDYTPVFQGEQTAWDRLCYLAVRGKADPFFNKSREPKFWLSFRSGIIDGEKFNLVIIQEDKKL